MKKRTRLWSILLTISLLLTLLPTTALAGGEETNAALTVGGVTMKPEEAGSGNGWSYDGNYNLTLDGYTDGRGIYFKPYDGVRSWLNVIVQGENSLSSINLNMIDSTADGAEYGYYAKLRLSGNGTLNLTGATLLGTGQTEKLVTITTGSNVAIKVPNRGTAIGEYAQITIEQDAVLTLVEDNAGGSLGYNRFNIQGGTLDITQATQETYWSENTDAKGCFITNGGTLKVTRSSGQPAILVKADMFNGLGLKATDGNGNPGVICNLNGVGNGHFGPSADSGYSDCYSTVVIREASACDHEWGGWEVTKEATCSEEGSETRTCSLCGAEQTRAIAKTAHTPVTDNAVDATCTTAGKTEGSHCSECDEVLVEQETIPALGHDWSTNDCAADATCSRCDEVRPAGTHIWGDWTVTKQPTCTEAGEKTSNCTNCGQPETEVIPAKGHTEVTDPAVPATCTKTGLTEGKHCSVCQTILTAQTETDALGHDWGEWVVTKEPTEAADGEETRTCSRCGETETQIVSKLPKQELEWPFNIGETVTYTYGNIPFQAAATNATADGGAMTYTSSNTDVATVASNGVVTMHNAGTTTITAAAEAVPGKYAKTEISYTLVVNKAALTVTANDHAITYGQAPANGGYTASGFMKGETDSVLTGTATYSYNYQQFGKAGEYAINISGLTAKNYDITFVSGKLTVNKAADYTITLGDLEQSTAGLGPVTAAIDPQDSTARFTVEYLVNGVWTTALPTEAGEYAVRAALASSDNIEPNATNTVEGTLVIKQGAFVDIGDDNVGVEVDVDGDKAEVTLPDGALDEILNNADGDVSIDLGGLEGVKDITLPGDLLDGLAKGDGALTIGSEDASISMSDKVLDTIADAVTDPDDKVTLHMTEVAEEDLNDAQRAALASLPDAPAIVDLSLVVTHADGSATTLSELDGNVTVSIPYTVPAGMEGQTAVACYISADGYVTYIRAKYENGGITFTTNHFSTYAVFVSTKAVVAVNGGSGNGLYAEGETVTIKADGKSGYRFNKWEVVAGDVILTDANAAETTFTMPAGNVELTATYTKISSGGGGGSSTPTYTITAEKAKNGSVTVSPKSASKGDTVTITVKPDKGYELDTLKVFDKNGDKVKVVEKNGKYTFTMPASKVTVEAVFVESKTLDNPFTDVNEDAYYFDSVLWAVENGVTSGTTATTFAPDATCTRAQTVTFLWRAMGSPEPTMTENPFSDVTADAYYYKAVLWAVEEGITSGTTATTFSPDATVTRAQTVTFLWRSAGSPAISAENPFVDVAADAYYADAVLWAAEQGITSGTSAITFAPNNNCTRAQIVTFIFRDAEK